MRGWFGLVLALGSSVLETVLATECPVKRLRSEAAMDFFLRRSFERRWLLDAAGAVVEEVRVRSGGWLAGRSELVDVRRRVARENLLRF